MKKLIIIAAVTFVASFVNAAQVQWSFTGLAADPDSTAWTGYHAYLCDASIYTASVLAEDLAAGRFEKLSTTGFVQATAGSVQQGTSALAKIDATYKGGDYATGETKTFYKLILNAAGNDATWFMTSAIKSGSAPATGNLMMSFTNISTTSGASSWTAVSVPEPTSGLLLLLGMASLALKRKHA